MLRVLKTEFYFDPFEIRWRYPELVFANPAISMVFFQCDPAKMTWGSLYLSQSTNPNYKEHPEVIRAFFDAQLQRTPFRAFGPQDAEILNGELIDRIYEQPVIIEQSPAEGIPFFTMLKGASAATIGTFIGVKGLDGNALLFISVPAGIIVVGSAIAITHAFEKGLANVVDRLTKSKSPPPKRPSSRRINVKRRPAS
jgi:hypothetical protein